MKQSASASEEGFSACTFCGSERLMLGPRGGACVNVFCMKCGAKFNVLLYPLFPMRLVDTLSPPDADRAELFERGHIMAATGASAPPPPSYDEFTCDACDQLIYSFPTCVPPPTRCRTCQWLEEFIDDPDERERLRTRLASP